MAGETVLEMKGIIKEFNDVQVLKSVDFDVKAGEVHALMGENGAGKSTLIKILTGIYPKDGGEIYINGQEVNIENRKDAGKYGIGVIYQELSLIPTLSVMQNVMLGKEQSNGGLLKVREMKKQVTELIDRYGFNLRANDIVETLTIAQRQTVEILKALSEKSNIIIMDEPTASLSAKESESLFKIIEQLREQGVSIIYISHRLEEVYRLSDRLTVLRDGEKVACLTKEQINPADVIRLMIGKELSEATASKPLKKPDTEPVLEVKNLTRQGVFEDVSFTLYKGEILGFGGLSECGMHEVGKAIFGASWNRKGSVTLADGTAINDIPTAIKHSVAYTSKDRDNESIILNESIRNNVVLPSLDDLANHGILSGRKLTKFAEEHATNMQTKMQGVQQFVSDLSGGNKQKVVLARWIGKGSDILVLDSPTRGIDVKVKQAIYALMADMKQKGKSIIMISEEIPELLGMSDRIFVMKDGHINGEFMRDPALSEEDLIAKMV